MWDSHIRINLKEGSGMRSARTVNDEILVGWIMRKLSVVELDEVWSDGRGHAMACTPP